MDLNLSKTVSIVLIRALEPKISFLEDWSDLNTKNVHKKLIFKKNRPIFWNVFYLWYWISMRWIHDIWALYPPYFHRYPSPPSLPYLRVFTPLWIFKTHKKSRFIKNSLNYLSDHLSNVLKWKYESSAF